ITKITWSNAANTPLVASGIEFRPYGGCRGKKFIVSARKELITPALLQLSGIGDSIVLGPLGMKANIDPKSVGRNLQEQTSSNFGANGTIFRNAAKGPQTHWHIQLFL
ncbi:glucose oxidase, partial [Moniliophthora roreri]